MVSWEDPLLLPQWLVFFRFHHERVLKNTGLADGSSNFVLFAEMEGTGTEKGVILFFPCVTPQD